MHFTNRIPSVPRGILILAMAGIVLWFNGSEYDSVQRAYKAAASLPVADYVVAGKHEVRATGRGSALEPNALFLDLVLSASQPGAPRSTVLAVSSLMYEQARHGDHWKGRLADGKPLFDPLVSGGERRSRKFIRVISLLLAAYGIFILVGAARGRE